MAGARVAGQALVAMRGGFGHRLGQVDDQPKVLVLLYSCVAEHLAHVQYAQAAHFQQVLQQLGAGAVEYVGRDLGEFGGIVCDQAMATAEQFQRQLALARSSLAGDQHADRVDLHEHAMQDHPRRQRTRQVVGQVVEQFVAALGRQPQRRAGFIRGGTQVFRARLVAGQHQRQRVRLHDLFDGLPTLARFQRIQPGQFLGAQDLHLVGIDGVEVAGQRGAPRDRVAGLQLALLAGLAGSPAQPQPLALLFEQFTGGDAGIHAALAGGVMSSASRRARASPASRRAWRMSGAENSSASSDSSIRCWWV